MNASTSNELLTLMLFFMSLVIIITLAILYYRQHKSQNTSLKHLNDTEKKYALLEQTNQQYQEDKSQLLSHQKNLQTQIDQLTNENKTLSIKHSEILTRYEESNKQLNQAQSNIDTLNNTIETKINENNTLKLTLTEQDTSLAAEKEKLLSLKEQFETQKNALKNDFKLFSEELLNERQKSLQQNNKEGLQAILNPLKTQIDQFQERVNKIHTETVQGNSSLSTEIKNVISMGVKISDEANNLASALKGSSQQRGAWGEAQLERTLEMSGLIQHTHYEKQSAFKDDKGHKKQTDYLIKLPNHKHLIIDSKVSLIAYDAVISSESKELQTIAMTKHAQSVKSHIDDLASKDYTNLLDIDSPDFILMFMPIEPAYIDALKYDNSLFEYGYKKNIILVSHTTLIPILRTVSNLWILQQSQDQTKEVSEKAGDIYNSVCLLAERLVKLGNTLNTASTHYNESVTAIAGRQGLQGKVERFKQLSTKISKKMPTLPNRHFEYETAQLSAEPLINQSSDEQLNAISSVREEITEEITKEITDQTNNHDSTNEIENKPQ